MYLLLYILNLIILIVMSLLSKIDIYGSIFTFTVFGSGKYRSSVGGILTILSLVLMLTFGFLFGRDFLYRVNPKIVSQNVIPVNYSDPFRLKPENLVIAWRIEDSGGNAVNFTDILYPVIMYNSFAKNKTTNEWEFFNSTYINVTKCTEISNYSMLSPPYDPSQFYCFDWREGDYFFGGNWDADFINYFTLSLTYCPYGQSWKESINCTSLEKLNSIFLGDYSWYFSLVYPQFYFAPDDLDNPLNVWYANYFYQLGLNLQKTDRFYFQDYQIDDDQGWIFSANNLTNLYAFQQNSFDYKYVTNESIVTKGSSSSFYNLIFYMQKQYQLYTRSYMKFQDLAAIIGGFIRLIMIACEIICAFLYGYMRDDLLYNEFFDLREKVGNTHSFSKDSILAFSKKTNQKLRQEDNSTEVLKTNSQLIHPTLQRNKYTKDTKLSEITFKRIEKKHVNFGLSYQIKRKCCYRNLRTEEDKKKLAVDKYLRVYFRERMDVLHYLKSLNKLERITSLLFNEHQAMALDFLKQTNPYQTLEERELEPVPEERRAREVIRYFREKIDTKGLDSTDINMLKYVSPEIVQHIK